MNYEERVKLINKIESILQKGFIIKGNEIEQIITLRALAEEICDIILEEKKR